MRTLYALPLSLLLCALPAQDKSPFRFVPADANFVVRISSPAKWQQQFAKAQITKLFQSQTLAPMVGMMQEGYAQAIEELRGLQPPVMEARFLGSCLRSRAGGAAPSFNSAASASTQEALGVWGDGAKGPPSWRGYSAYQQQQQQQHHSNSYAIPAGRAGQDGGDGDGYCCVFAAQISKETFQVALRCGALRRSTDSRKAAQQGAIWP